MGGLSFISHPVFILSLVPTVSLLKKRMRVLWTAHVSVVPKVSSSLGSHYAQISAMLTMSRKRLTCWAVIQNLSALPLPHQCQCLSSGFLTGPALLFLFLDFKLLFFFFILMGAMLFPVLSPDGKYNFFWTKADLLIFHVHISLNFLPEWWPYWSPPGLVLWKEVEQGLPRLVSSVWSYLLRRETNMPRGKVSWNDCFKF